MDGTVPPDPSQNDLAPPLECVVNISEGRDLALVETIAGVAGEDRLDVHHDPDHNRSVLTLIGEEAPRRVARAGVELLDLRGHHGVHPRIGVVDVVPFVPLTAGFSEALAARDEFAAWAAHELGVPCFLYGPERTLPDIRRSAFKGLAPDVGPREPHPTAGAIAVGARGVLVAYNLWLANGDVGVARSVAKAIRGRDVRALGLPVAGGAQVSLNLLAPMTTGPADVYDFVQARAPIERAELVGLIPVALLNATPRERWVELDLGPEKTIEWRLGRRALRAKPGN